MSNDRNDRGELGVLIGRFQVSDLHEGHKGLIENVIKRHNKILILIGKTPGILGTRNDPLDYHTRMLMIRDSYPDVSVLPINDEPTDEGWSKSVDRQIQSAFDGVSSAILYGSRDSFIPHYCGKWQTVSLESSASISGTELRKSISDSVRNTAEFRRGVIYGAYNKHPVAYMTVDAAIVNTEKKTVVLGEKMVDNGLLRFPGGFVDPQQDISLEYAVKREAREEIPNVETDDPIYIGSRKVDDWRYKSGPDCIITNLFFMEFLYGSVLSGDDLDNAHIVSLVDFDLNTLVPEHRPLMEMLLTYLKKRS